MVLCGIHVLISNIFMNRFHNGPALDERFNLLLNRQIRFFHQSADNTVGAGVGPVRFRQCFLIPITGLYIVDNAPGIINFRLTKLIAVIPFPDGMGIILQIISFKQLIYFFLRKSKMFRIGVAGDGNYIEVVKPCKTY